MKRVVITGIGAVTPVGSTLNESWDAVKRGTSGIRKITKLSSEDLRWKSAGEVRTLRPELYLSKKELNFTDPFVLFALAAAEEAIKSSGLHPGDKDLIEAGVIIGSSRGGITTVERELGKIAACGRNLRPSPHLMPGSTISAAASLVAIKFGIRGICLGISNACASGTNAIGEAFLRIRCGLSSVMVAGGTEAPLCRLCIEGYGSAGALSKLPPKDASRPFDISRDGFILSEGSCMIVLEELQSAINRNAPILAEIAGYGNTCDAFHPTKPSVKGEIGAINYALHDADITPHEIGYINAHGTSTFIGDMVEAEAINNIFGAYSVPVSSIKSMTGHMLAASGAFETACTAMSIKEAVIPGTINTRSLDPKCRVNLIRQTVNKPLDTAITNSFGFGGLNAVLVLRRY